MEDQKFSLSGSFQKGKEYIDTQIDLLKLKIISRASRMMGALALDLVKILLALLIILFLSMALGFFLGEVLNSYALGFLTTAGIFLIIIFIIKAIEPRIESFFMDLMIRKVLDKWNEEDDYEDNEAYQYQNTTEKNRNNESTK